MKPGLNFGLIAFLWAGWPAAQDVVSNPKQAAAPKAGRVVELRLEEAVASGSGKSTLSRPEGLKSAPDLSLYVQDGVRLLKFDAAGGFIREFYAGESSRAVAGTYSGGRPQISQSGFNFILDGTDVVCCDLRKSKILVLDHEGKTRKEIPLDEPIIGARLIAADKERFLLTGRPWQSMQPGSMTDFCLFSLSAEGKTLTPIVTFTSHAENLSQTQDGPAQFSSLQIFAPLMMAVSENRRAYASHTPEYGVKVVDLESGRILRTFRRDYDRVENMDPQGSSGAALQTSRGAVSPPKLKIKNDIAGLFPRGDRLRVLTSTHDTTKGTLVDVFDPEGRYLDCFFLKAEVDGRVHEFSGSQTWMMAEAVYFAAKAGDGTYRILKGALPDGI